jgi:hypothetical protein
LFVIPFFVIPFFVMPEGNLLLALADQHTTGGPVIEQKNARVAHSSSGFWLDEWGARVLEARFAWRLGPLWFPTHAQRKAREWATRNVWATRPSLSMG